MHTPSIKNQAVKLRRSGESLLAISKSLNISKSTASLWLRSEENRGIYSSMTKQEWMIYIRAKSHESAQKRKLENINKINSDAHLLANSFKTNLQIDKALLAMLYWSEGAKGHHEVVNFANTDPGLIKLFITLFRRCYPISEDKFRLRIHLHKYHDETDAKKFWSTLTNIPLEKIGKIYWKKEPNSGRRYRQNYQGICFLRYNDVRLQRELTAYAHALGEKLVKKMRPSFNG